MEPGDDLHGYDSDPTPQRARTFVLRIWFEPCGAERGPMRGTLTRLGGPVIGAFQSMAELAALLERVLAPRDDTRAPPADRPRI
jgi:hypothetical protein